MSNYGWVGKHTDELLQAVGMINHEEVKPNELDATLRQSNYEDAR